MHCGHICRCRRCNENRGDGEHQCAHRELDGRRAAGEGDLYSVPLSGGGERRLTHSEVAENSQTLSADGSRLAYVSFVSGVARIWIASGDATSASPVSDVLASSNTVYA